MAVTQSILGLRKSYGIGDTSQTLYSKDLPEKYDIEKKCIRAEASYPREIIGHKVSPK